MRIVHKKRIAKENTGENGGGFPHCEPIAAHA
jgi:hypothetical protein